MCQADELFFGGQAGGGKTDLLIGAATTRHRKSIIFRREYPQLKDIVMRAKEITGGSGTHNGQDHIIRLNERTIEFGAVQYEDAVNKYKGRPHDFIGFDELTEFTQTQYKFLSGWLRSTIKDQHCRIIGASNPPTNAEGEWVIDYFGPWLNEQHPNPAQSGELRWFAAIDGQDKEVESGAIIEFKGERIKPRSRTFIPARLADNIYLANTDYESVLQSLPEPLRSQLLYGKFNAKAMDNPYQVIPTAWVQAAMERGKQRERPADLAMTTLGCDPARGGDDEMVIACRVGNWYAPLVRYAGAQVPDGPTAATFVMQAREAGAIVALDVIGIGTSVYDSLKPRIAAAKAAAGESGGGSGIVGVNFAERSTGTDKSGRYKFRNLRAQYYWKFREALDPERGMDISLPYDRKLLADLCAARYEVTPAGIQIEDKDDIKKRIGRSPDSGDAVVLALFTPVKYGFG